MHNWTYTWWKFKQDDGSQPLKDYMNLRPASMWEETRDIMEQCDYSNVSGWRHQHSGRRLQWEDLYNQHLPQWRHILENDPASWHTHRDRVIKDICAHNNLQYEGHIKNFVNTAVGDKKKNKRKARTEINTDSWQEDGAIQNELRHRLTEQEAREGKNTVETITDNEALADILGGRAKPESNYEIITGNVLSSIAEVMVKGKRGPKGPTEDPVKWVKREFNKESDYLANYVMDLKEDFHFTGNMANINWDNGHLVGWSDGGSRREEDCSASAWILKHIDGEGKVQVIGAAAKYVDKAASSSMEVECLAMCSLWNFIESVVFNRLRVTSSNSMSKFNWPAKRRRLTCFPATTYNSF
jgi:hypothetical protein